MLGNENASLACCPVAMLRIKSRYFRARTPIIDNRWWHAVFFSPSLSHPVSFSHTLIQEKSVIVFRLMFSMWRTPSFIKPITVHSLWKLRLNFCVSLLLPLQSSIFLSISSSSSSFFFPVCSCWLAFFYLYLVCLPLSMHTNEICINCAKQ